ncbi:MAG: hypothetical protein WDO73_17325 [Ignavibacteriota bacterium]
MSLCRSLVSSRGYGIFWDNMSYSRFGDLRPFEAIPTANLLSAEGRPGGLTMAPLDGSSPAATWRTQARRRAQRSCQKHEMGRFAARTFHRRFPIPYHQ